MFTWSTLSHCSGIGTLDTVSEMQCITVHIMVLHKLTSRATDDKFDM